MRIYKVYANRLASLEVKTTRLYYITTTRKKEFKYFLRFLRKSCYLSPMEAIKARFDEEKKHQKNLEEQTKISKKTVDALIKLEEKYR